MTRAPQRWAALAQVLAALPDPVRRAVVPGRLLADVEAVLAGAVVGPRVVVLSPATRDAEAVPLLWYSGAPYDLLAAAPVRVEPVPPDEPAPTFRPAGSDVDLVAALRGRPLPADLAGARPGDAMAARYRGWNEVRSAVSRRAALISHAAREAPDLLGGRLREPAVLLLPGDHPDTPPPALTAVTLHPRRGAPGPVASGVAELLRVELLDADALVVVVDYERLVGVDDEPLAALGGWVHAAHRQLGADRVTVAVDGLERSRSTPSNLRAWITHACRRRLHLPDGWPDDGIVALRSRTAVARLRQRTRSTVPAVDVHSGAEADWARTGVPRLMARTVAPWLADPALAGSAAVHRRLSRTIGGLHRWCTGVLALAESPNEPLDPDLVLDLDYARRRETWLLARGLRTLTTTVPALPAQR